MLIIVGGKVAIPLYFITKQTLTIFFSHIISM